MPVTRREVRRQTQGVRLVERHVFGYRMVIAGAVLTSGLLLFSIVNVWSDQPPPESGHHHHPTVTPPQQTVQQKDPAPQQPRLRNPPTVAIRRTGRKSSRRTAGLYRL